jgi:glycosyltransferase involved in cell wall biosynthesis
VSVIVPVYNSQGTLPELVRRVGVALDELVDGHEIVLVNDGSHDGSWGVIEELVGAWPQVRGIDLMRNYGQHNAILAGLRAARGEVVVTLDDDLQHPPEEIAKLLARISEGADVVYGVPRAEQHGILRDLASQVTKLALQSAMGAKTARQVSAFRALRTQLRDAFASYQGSFVSIDVLLTWATTRFGAVVVEHRPREIGKSNYTFGKLITHAVNMMTGFGVWPLQIASMIGFAFTVFGGILLAYVLGRYVIQGSSVPGFPFLASVIAIFSGAQLFALGIIGEYLARMHFRIMDKPAYTVRRTATPPAGPDGT